MPKPFATRAGLRTLMRSVTVAHDALPWRIRRLDDATVELRADADRRRACADPRGRRLGIAFGSALFNLRLAVRMTGHDARVLPAPHAGPERGVTALVRAEKSAPPSEEERRLYAVLGHEAQAGRGRDAAPGGMPSGGGAAGTHGPGASDGRAVLVELVTAAHLEGATLLLVGGRAARRALGRGPAPDVVGWSSEGGVLFTRGDGPRDWLRAGQALQRVLLTAAAHGVLPAPADPGEGHGPLGSGGRFGHAQLLLRFADPAEGRGREENATPAGRADREPAEAAGPDAGCGAGPGREAGRGAGSHVGCGAGSDVGCGGGPEAGPAAGFTGGNGS
ncbi:hypothetical protein [Nonomuraea pusilla]|uniref:Uncharacterized protein n=1 Tax=Nonomuraea pusilla TaxID=46177 RepID=A0A1H8J5R3_9ACTN|nr:hypothetical protein [Nonomuraea pusilla]SEN75931.1 hypothetical protein SAMN05660976_08260 [Nonomuraea pusilla]